MKSRTEIQKQADPFDRGLYRLIVRAANSSSLVNSRRMMRAFNVMFGRCAMRLHAFSIRPAAAFAFIRSPPRCAELAPTLRLGTHAPAPRVSWSSC